MEYFLLLLVILGLPPLLAAALRRRYLTMKRPASKRCFGCGYVLAGLEAYTACPECGRVHEVPRCRHCGCALQGLDALDVCPECGESRNRRPRGAPLIVATPLIAGILGFAGSVQVSPSVINSSEWIAAGLAFSGTLAMLDGVLPSRYVRRLCIASMAPLALFFVLVGLKTGRDAATYAALIFGLGSGPAVWAVTGALALAVGFAVAWVRPREDRRPPRADS